MPVNIEIYLILNEKNHFMKIICLKTIFFVKSIPFEETDNKRALFNIIWA